MACAGTMYYSFMPVFAESIALWVTVFLLIAYTVLAEKYDAIVLNGALMAFYVAILTSKDLNTIDQIETSRMLSDEWENIDGYEKILGQYVEALNGLQQGISGYMYGFFFDDDFKFDEDKADMMTTLYLIVALRLCFLRALFYITNDEWPWNTPGQGNQVVSKEEKADAGDHQRTVVLKYIMNAVSAVVLTHLWENLGLYSFGIDDGKHSVTNYSGGTGLIRVTLYVRLVSTLLYVWEKVEASPDK